MAESKSLKRRRAWVRNPIHGSLLAFARVRGRGSFAPREFFYTRTRVRGHARAGVSARARRLGVVLAFGLVFLAGLGFSLARPAQTNAATSNTINFQARLETNAGAIVPDGNYNVEFKLYEGGTTSGGGTLKWTEDYLNTASQGIAVANGYLTANLGSIQSLASAGIDWDQQLYLTMNIGGTTTSGTPSWDGEMSPRLLITAVPYAFRAGSLADPAGTGSTLGWASQTSAHSLLLPNEAGTLCVENSANCGFALTSGSGNYIQNGTSPQTANFNITGSGTVGSFTDTGTALFKTSSNTAFQIQNSGGTSNLFVANTNNSVIGIGEAPTASNGILQLKGALTLNGGAAGATNFTTPVGSSVPTAINIPLYDPGDHGQILALGLPNGAYTTARAISVFDDRSTTDNQPAIGVFNSNETNILGFSWDGSVTTGYVKILSGGAIGFKSGTTTLLGLDSTGNATLTGDMQVQGGDITTNQTTFNLLNTTATTLNIGGAAGSGGINLAGGSGSTGCTINGSTGALTCSGTLTVGTNTSLSSTTLTIGGNAVCTASGCTSSGGITTVGTLDSQTPKSANGAIISGTSIYLQSADGSNPGLVTASPQTFGGDKTFSGNVIVTGTGLTTPLVTSSAGLTVQAGGTNGALALDSNGTGAITIGTSATNKTISIGNNTATGATQTINIGYIANPGALNTILTNVNIGSASNSNATTTIQAGIANGSIQIGSLNSGATQTINLGTNTTAVQTVKAGSTYSSSTTTIQGGTGGITLNATSGAVNLQTTTSGAINLKPAGSSNVVVGTSNTTGTLFVLDTKTSSGDPTGVNGGMYYNSSSGLFRCYQAGTWQDCVGAGAGVNSLQAAYNGGNTINLASGTPIEVTSSGSGGSALEINVASGNSPFIDWNNGTSAFGIRSDDSSLHIGAWDSSAENTFNNDFSLGTDGSVLLQNSTNSTTAFQVQNANITPTTVLDVDTTNSRVGIGTAAPDDYLTVAPGSNALATLGVKSSGGSGAEVDLGYNGTYTASIGYNRNVGNAIEFAVGGTTFNTPQNGGNTVFTINGNGSVLSQNNTDSTSAFQIQNAAGTTTVLGVDTQDGTIGLGTTPATSTELYVWSGSTKSGQIINQDTSSTADLLELQHNGSDVAAFTSTGQLQLATQGSTGGLTIGGDTALYRVSSNLLGLGNGDSLRAFSSSGGQYMTLQSAASTVYLEGRSANTSDWILDGATTADTQPRYILKADGTMQWSGGSGTPDLQLTRSGVGSMAVQSLTNSTTAFQIQSAGGANTLFDADTQNSRVKVSGSLNVGTLGGNRLFTDGFESGSFGLWDGGANGAASISSSTVYDGKYAAKINPSGSAAYVKTSIAANATTYAQAWVYVSSQTSSNDDLLTIGDEDTPAAWTVFRDSSGDVELWNGVAGASAATGPAFTTGAWHLIQMRITIGSGTGISQVWLDGTQIINATSQNNGTTAPSSIEIGDPNNSRTHTDYFDDVIADTSQITTPTSSLSVDDSLHVGGTASFGSSLSVEQGSNIYLGTYGSIMENSNTNLTVTETNGGIALQSKYLDFNDTYNSYDTEFAIQNGGQALFQNAVDSSTAFQVQDHGGNSLLNVDTTHGTVSVGGPTTVATFKVTSSTSGQVGLIVNKTAGTDDIMDLQNGGSTVVQVDNTGDLSLYQGSLFMPNDYGIYFNDNGGTARQALTYSSANNLSLVNHGSTGSVQIQNNNDSGSIQFRTGSSQALVANLSATGQALFQNSQDSSTAFQIQNTGGTPLLAADTSGMNLNVTGTLNVQGIAAAGGTAPTVIGGSTLGGTNATSRTIATNSSTQAGDLVIITAYVEPANESSSSATYGTISTPTGVVPLSGFPINTDDSTMTSTRTHRMYNWYYYATASGSQNLTFTDSVGPWWGMTTVTIRGGATSGNPLADPVDTNTTSQAATGVTTTPPVSLDLGSTNSLVLWAYGDWIGSNTNRPTGYTTVVSTGDNPAIAQRTYSSAGSTGSVYATASGSDDGMTAALMSFRSGTASNILNLENSSGATVGMVDGSGNVTLQGSDSSTALQVEDSSSNVILGVDTASDIVNVGGDISVNNPNNVLRQFTFEDTGSGGDWRIGDTTGPGNNPDGLQGGYSLETELYSYWGLVLGGNRESTNAPDFFDAQTHDADVTILGSGNSTSDFQVINSSSGNATLSVNDSYNSVNITGGGSNGGGGRLSFGDYNPTNDNAVWVGEYGTGDTDQLQLNGEQGIEFTAGSYNSPVLVGYINSSGVLDTSNGFMVSGTAGISLTCGTSKGIKSVRISGGIITSATCTSNNLTDLAEQYNSTESLNAAEVVAVDHNNGQYVERSTLPHQDDLIGVVSTDPNYVLGADNPGYPIALSGRVPVKVNLEGGAIEPGDKLTSSSTPGVAMKATGPGEIIGTAMTAYDGSQSIAQVIVFVDTGYYNGPEPLTYIQNGGDASLGNLTVNGLSTVNDLQSDGTSTLNNLVASTATVQNLTSTNSTIESLTVGGDANVGNLLASGAITTNDLTATGSTTVAGLTATSISATSASIGDITVSGAVTTGDLTVTGTTTLGKLIVTGNARIKGSLILDGHFVTGGHAPTVQAEAAAGDGAICTVTGNDTGGSITIKTGGTSLADGSQCKLTFHKAFAKVPNPVISPRNKDSAQAEAFIDSDASGMTIQFSNAPAANTSYVFSYFNTQ